MPEFDARSPRLIEQEHRNRATREHWQLFADHRRRVTDLLIGAAPEEAKTPAKLCVLGAGNCNDLDLPRLLSRFSRLHLVDWDGEALSQGLARQGQAGNSAVVCHGGIDLTGIGTTPNLPSSSLSNDEFSKFIGRLHAAPLPPIGEPVEVVASDCLLSQLLEGVGHLLLKEQLRLLDAVQTVRQRHLQMLVELLAPGGTGLLICDVVSSDTLPQLLTAQEVEIAPLVAGAIAQRNFFTGLNPAVLLSLFATDPLLSSTLEEIVPISPWRWNLGSRVYAVFGIRFRRRSA